MTQTTRTAVSAGLLAMVLLPCHAVAQASSPRELLGTVGIDESAFDALAQADFDDLQSGDVSAIEHLVTTLQRFDLIDVERWRQPLPSNLESEAESVGTLFRVGGVVELIAPKTTPTGGTIYHITLQLSPNAPQVNNATTSPRLSVWAKQIPNAWHPLVNQPVRITVKSDALLIKTDSPTFATSRFEWLPSDHDSGPPVASHLVKAASIGIDVSLFEQIEHGKKVSSADRECFYQCLSRADKIESVAVSEQNSTDESDPFNIVDLLQKPREQTGRIYEIKGIARRAVRIPVSDSDIKKRFGIDHYYEVDVFVPMKSMLILQDEKTGDKVRYDKYPMTFCVRQLPPGFPEGPVITQAVTLHAMYFKLWSYRNELLGSSGNRSNAADAADRRQQSPLFIARSPTLRFMSNQSSRAWNSTAQLIGLTLALVIVLVAMLLYRNSRRDDALRRKRGEPQSVTINLPE